MRFILAYFQLFLLVLAVVFHSQECDAQRYQHGLFRLGLEGGSNSVGDEFTRTFSDYTYRPAGLLSFEYYPLDNIGVHLLGYAGDFTNHGSNLRYTRSDRYLPFDEASYTTKYFGGGLGASYRIPLIDFISPIVFVRAGLLMRKTSADLGPNHIDIPWNNVLTYGAGCAVETALSSALTLRFSYAALLTNSDDLDGFVSGEENDGISMFTIGFFWSINPLQELPPLPWSTALGSAPADSKQRPDEQGNPEGNSQGNGNESPGSKTFTGEEGTAETLRDGPVDFSTKLRVLPFSSFEDLQSNPEKMQLSVEQETENPAPIRVMFALKKDEKDITSGLKKIVVPGTKASFDAKQFIDFNSLNEAQNLGTALPTGEYEIVVSTRREGNARTIIGRKKFQHIDVESLFRNDASSVRYLFTTGRAQAEITRKNGLKFNVFGEDFLSDPRNVVSGVDEENDIQFAAGNQELDKIIRDAATAIPSTVQSQEKANYVATTVRTAFNKAGLLANAYNPSPEQAQHISIVVSEVYFPFDATQISEETRTILDNVAQNLKDHPDIHVEIQGYADEIGDDAYNMLLSQRRADKVFEYLNRKQISNERMQAIGVGKQAALDQSSPYIQQHNRKVEIIHRVQK